MTLVLECVVICFILFLPCVVAIANGIHNAAFLFEKDVQAHVVSMGLITEEKIKRNGMLFKIPTLIVIVGNPLIAAILSGVMLLFTK